MEKIALILRPTGDCGRGPSVPLLFNLAADALAHISGKAKAQGLIKGVVPHLIQGDLTHLQYADYTVLLCEGDDRSIQNLKFLLYCFEWMSGLKINYHKSELVSFGLSQEEEDKIVNKLNCEVGVFPMKYLGFPISDIRLGVHSFKGIVVKMGHRLQPWKGRNLSSGGDPNQYFPQ
jgi:hypothetical protein